MQNWVYIICDNNHPFQLYKIGYSCAPRRRLSQLKRQCHNRNLTIIYAAAVPNGLPPTLIERQLHTLLLPHRSHGEWFDFPLPRLISAIIRAIQQLSHAIQEPLQPLRRTSKRWRNAVDDYKMLRDN